MLNRVVMKMLKKENLVTICIQTIISVVLILNIMSWNTLIGLGFLTIVNLIIGISVSKSFGTKTFSVLYDERNIRIDIFKTIAMNVLVTLIVFIITLVSLAIIRVS